MKAESSRRISTASEDLIVAGRYLIPCGGIEASIFGLDFFYAFLRVGSLPCVI